MSNFTEQQKQGCAGISAELESTEQKRKAITRKEAKEQGLKVYFTGKLCKYGHIGDRITNSGACLICSIEYQSKYRQENKETANKYKRKYYQENKEAISEKSLRYQQENKEAIAKQKREYRQENKEAVAKYCRKYYQENKEKITKYRQENPIPVFIRNSLNRIQDNWKGSREDAEASLGYTYEQLRQRIEFNFKDGMSWDNRSKWHIDHKKPISRFIKQGITDPKIINALSNLQPLWSIDNLTKSNKYEPGKL